MLEKMAQQNNPKALFCFGEMKLYGFAVDRNSAEGMKLITTAAEKKYLPAQMYLGRYYFDRKHDLKNAAIWFRKAASNGNTSAQLYTVLAYFYGYGVKKNEDISRRYAIITAKQGIPLAQYELANIFLESKHRSDQKMGAVWLQKAAQKGYADAQFKFGMKLYSGAKNIRQDKKQALHWIRKAAEKGNADAKKQLQMLNAQKEQSVINQGTQDVAEKNNNPKNTAWDLLKATLNNANVTLTLPKVMTAKEGAKTITPKIIQLTKGDILKADYRLVESNDIPINEIITYISKVRYRKENNEIQAQEYAFKKPYGAKTDKEAFRMLSRQAKFGYPQALFKLGQMYEYGIVVKSNSEKAFKLFEHAAAQKYLKAEYTLGLYYLQGRVVHPDAQRAVALFYHAALKGSVPAQFVLGNIYEFGLGNKSESDYVKPNVMRAKSMYSLASHHDFGLAQYRLAQLYSSGLLNPSDRYEITQKNLALAEGLYKEAEKNGVKKATLARAYFSLMKPHNSQENTMMFKIVEKAAKKNDEAKLLLAILYDRGVGTGKDVSEAMDLFEELADKNNAIAEFALGTHYIKDDDEDDGIELLEKAAQQDNPYAQFNLAVMAKTGKYVNPNEDFLSLLNKAIKNGYDRASVLLADYYLTDHEQKGMVRKSAAIYQNLAKKQDPDAELKLGLMYETGVLFSQNSQKALSWYEKSARHQDKVAQYLAGYMYLIGKGATRNANTALTYFSQAAKQRYVPAEVGLGFTYEIAKQNYAKAFPWYEKAAEMENRLGLYNLSLMYKYGKGVEVSERKARKLMKKAGDV